MNKKDILDYYARCKLFNQPCIMDDYYEIEVIEDIICLKRLNLLLYFKSHLDGSYLKFPDYIERILPHAVQTDDYTNKKRVSLDLNNVNYIHCYAFNACFNLQAIIGNKVEYMAENAIVLYIESKSLDLCFEKLNRNQVRILPIISYGAIVYLRCKDTDEVLDYNSML